MAKADSDSPVVPGKPYTVEEFRELILSRENDSSMSIKEAKAKWAKKRRVDTMFFNV